MTLWITEELGFYTQAFWGTVATSLRNILNPKVSFRMAETIITTMCLDGQCVDKNGILEISKTNDKKPSIEVVATTPTAKPPTTTTTTTTAKLPTTTTPTAKPPTTTTTTPTAKPPTTTTTTAKSPRPLYMKDGFLLGEETPVWIGTARPKRWRSDTSYDFTRVKPNESPSAVRSALNYWDSLKKGSGFQFRRKRSIDDHGNFTYMEEFYDALNNAEINRFDSPSLVEKRSADSMEVVYPSVLVVMDYAMARSIDEHVLYALAFWSSLDSTMRNIQNPRVSLRIVGIVITSSREVTPYLTSNQYGYSFNSAMRWMFEYWRNRNRDFPIGSYDIVAHMTDIFPHADRELWSRTFPNRHKHRAANDFFGGVASSQLPCKVTNQISAVIFRDNFNFNGMFRAKQYMSEVLGGRDTPRPYYINFHREWTKNMLDSLSDSLKHASCMSAPKEYFPLGTPVAPILAGELVPNEKQCQSAGYNPGAWTCWDTSYKSRVSTCRDLQCSNGRVWGLSCNKVGRPLEGSFCNTANTKICLDGECVDKI